MTVDFHFLNVGHGDCTFIDFDGDYLTMIDVNNSKSLPEKDRVALVLQQRSGQPLRPDEGDWLRSAEALLRVLSSFRHQLHDGADR